MTAPPGRTPAQEAGSVGVPSAPGNCTNAGCDCRLIGITGGVMPTDASDAYLVFFATQLADDAPQEASGLLPWFDSSFDGGLNLESVGPFAC